MGLVARKLWGLRPGILFDREKCHLQTMNKVFLGGDHFDGTFELVKRGNSKILNYFY